MIARFDWSALKRTATVGGALLTLLLSAEVSAATFTVTSFGEGSDAIPGDGVAEIQPGTGITTFHAAIEEANAFPGPDTIRINLPFNAICGDCKVPCIVRLTYERPLPPVNDPTAGTYIDFSGVTFFNGRRMKPALGPEGFNAGLVLLSAGNTVTSITMDAFPGDGIVISGPAASGNTIVGVILGV
jgi:hypothetical protein